MSPLYDYVDLFYNKVSLVSYLQQMNTVIMQKHVTLLNFNKKSNILVLHTLMGSIIKEYVKKLFQGIASIVLCKKYFLVTSKMVSSNKQNPMIFCPEIGLEVIF